MYILDRGLHLVRTHPGVGGLGEASYTFSLRITCKMGGGGWVGPDSM